MTNNSRWGKSFTLQNHWGSNISPRKKGITILICHLAPNALISPLYLLFLVLVFAMVTVLLRVMLLVFPLYPHCHRICEELDLLFFCTSYVVLQFLS